MTLGLMVDVALHTILQDGTHGNNGTGNRVSEAEAAERFERAADFLGFRRFSKRGVHTFTVSHCGALTTSFLQINVLKALKKVWMKQSGYGSGGKKHAVDRDAILHMAYEGVDPPRSGCCCRLP